MKIHDFAPAGFVLFEKTGLPHLCLRRRGRPGALPSPTFGPLVFPADPKAPRRSAYPCPVASPWFLPLHTSPVTTGLSTSILCHMRRQLSNPLRPSPDASRLREPTVACFQKLDPSRAMLRPGDVTPCTYGRLSSEKLDFRVFRCVLLGACRAEVAQVVEHRTENPGVGSSTLPLGTIFAGVAQLVEHITRNDEVRGSTPRSSSSGSFGPQARGSFAGRGRARRPLCSRKPMPLPDNTHR